MDVALLSELHTNSNLCLVAHVVNVDNDEEVLSESGTPCTAGTIVQVRPFPFSGLSLYRASLSGFFERALSWEKDLTSLDRLHTDYYSLLIHRKLPITLLQSPHRLRDLSGTLYFTLSFPACSLHATLLVEDMPYTLSLVLTIHTLPLYRPDSPEQ